MDFLLQRHGMEQLSSPFMLVVTKSGAGNAVESNAFELHISEV
jgi:hypothetical protein